MREEANAALVAVYLEKSEKGIFMNHDRKKRFRICRCFSGVFLISIFIPTLFSAQTIWAGEKNYDLAVIYTQEYKNSSRIDFFAEDKIGTETYRYANLCMLNERVYDVNGNIYMAALGDSDSLDYSTILSYDPVSLAVEEYKFDRVNITDFQIDGENIIVSSNLNWEFYLDRYNTRTGEMDSIQTSQMIGGFLSGQDVCYAVGEDLESYHSFLYQFDYESGECKTICKLSDDTCQGYFDLAFYEQMLCVLFEQKIYCYNTVTGELTEKELCRNSPYQLRVFDEELYIIYSDPLSDSTDGNGVERFDIQTMDSYEMFDYDGYIRQMEMKEDRIYILNYDCVEKYTLLDQALHLEQKYELEFTDEYYCGGMFVKW